MIDFDVSTTQWINELSSRLSLLDHVMILVSSIGVPLLIASVAAQWWVKSNRTYTRHVLVAAGLSFLLGLGVNQIILLFMQRLRPYDTGVTHLLIERSADPSFPSDHATASFAIAAAFLIHGMRTWGILYSLAALLVMFARVFIGIHYASDVLGGALIGACAAGLVALGFRPGTRIDRIVTGIL